MIRCGYCGEALDGNPPILMAAYVNLVDDDGYEQQTERAAVCPNCRAVLSVLADPDRPVQRGAGLET